MPELTPEEHQDLGLPTDNIWLIFAGSIPNKPQELSTFRTYHGGKIRGYRIFDNYWDALKAYRKELNQLAIMLSKPRSKT